MDRVVSDDHVQWQVSVSRDTDADARDFLRSQGLQESDVSVLVEDAIQMYLFQRTVRDVQTRNDNEDGEELRELADIAVRSVRREMHLDQA